MAPKKDYRIPNQSITQVEYTRTADASSRSATQSSASGKTLAFPATATPLQCFLRSRPPRLDMDPMHTDSTATRPPMFFDMHLHESLRLKRVEFLDGLTSELAKVCDPYIDSEEMSISGKDRSSSFKPFVAPSGTGIVNEDTLQKHLEKLSKQFSRVASGLLFKTDWLPIFSFSKKPKGYDNLNEAIADSYLFIEDKPEILGHLSPTDLSHIKLIEKHHFQNFAVAEFKSIRCGQKRLSQEVMQSFAGDFDWVACMEKSSPKRTAPRSCLHIAHRIDGRLKTTGRQTGPDSAGIADLIERSRLSSRPKLASASSQSGTSGDHDLRPSRSQWITTADKGHTRDILQQLWTATVVQDATYVVLSCGNEEYIGIRHRDSQTLFISPLIRPSDATDPSYVKIRVALCIASYKDAFNRAKQLENIINTGSQALLPRFRLDIDEQLHLSKSVKPVAKSQKELLESSDELILKDLKSFSEISLFLHNFNLAGAAQQFDPDIWVLHRVGPHQALPRARSNRVARIELDSQIPHSRAYKVYLEIVDESSGDIKKLSSPLFLKVSWCDEEAKRLRDEHRKYEEYGNIDGLVKHLGLFSCHISAHEERYFLLQEYGGDSLYLRLNNLSKNGRGAKKDAQKYLEQHHPSKFYNALGSLHERGYIHNNITLHNLLVNVKRKKAYLVGLQRSGRPARDCIASLKQKDRWDLNYWLGTETNGKDQEKAKHENEPDSLSQDEQSDLPAQSGSEEDEDEDEDEEVEVKEEEDDDPFTSQRPNNWDPEPGLDRLGRMYHSLLTQSDSDEELEDDSFVLQHLNRGPDFGHLGRTYRIRRL